MNRICGFAVASVLAAVSLPGTAAAKQYGVVIDQMKFGALPAGLKVGDSLHWTNRDMFRHSVTAGDGSFDLDLAPGASGTIVLKHAGAVRFSCKYHPGMKGTIGVRR